jgi:hypothetical protein
MQPADLRAEQFARYPSLGRQLATKNLPVMQKLPQLFLPILLREVITYDWKFPVERRELDSQFDYLNSLTTLQLKEAMAGFSAIQLGPVPTDIDWINYPQIFSEYLSTTLWATGQIDAFRTASTLYVNAYQRATPPDSTLVPRLTMVVVGNGVDDAGFALFRKLRPYGVYYSAVRKTDAREALFSALVKRAQTYPAAYGHWYVDGGEQDLSSMPRVTTASYSALSGLRLAVIERMRTLGQESGGPRGLQKMMDALSPAQFPAMDVSGDPVMNHFLLSIFTDGSGTQFYSTTFAQWTARELLRRAQPATTLVRFAPRQVQRSFDEMILDRGETVAVDPHGSLMDADMAAFYIWLDQRRLPKYEDATYLVWFENHQEALMIAPHLQAGTASNTPTSLRDLLKPAL